MLYDVLVVSNGDGGKRFTNEADAQSYRVLAIQTGHGPFAGVIEAEWLASLGPSESAPR